MAHPDEAIAAQLADGDDERIECGARMSVDGVAAYHATELRGLD